MTESLILALAGFASFGSITIVILLLTSDKGWYNGIGYILGYNISYAIIGITIIVLGFSKANILQENPNILFPILYISLGTLLLFLGFRNLYRLKAKIKKTPSLPIFSSLGNITPLKSFGFGIMVSVINIKNLTLFLSAISVVHLSNFNLYFKIINTLLVTFIFCFVLIIPLLIVLFFPKSSTKILNSIKNKIETHIHILEIIFPILFGFILISSGVLKLI